MSKIINIDFTSTDNNIKEMDNIYTNKNAFSTADEILKFKQLLDLGVINQEEFDTQKRQLLST